MAAPRPRLTKPALPPKAARHFPEGAGEESPGAATDLKDVNNEAHLSAFPAGPQTAAWFPLALGNARRAQGAGEPQGQRSQEAQRLSRAGAAGEGPRNSGFRPLPAIRARRDFLAANRGARIVTPAFILLVMANGVGRPRAGFTASRKIGNSVARNRAKRRLREMARLLNAQAVPGADHVFIARAGTAERPFADLLADGANALARAQAKLARAAS